MKNKEQNNIRTKKSNIYFASKLYLDVLTNELKYGVVIGLFGGIIGAFIPYLLDIFDSATGKIIFSIIVGIYAVKVTIEHTMNNSVVLKEQITKVPIIMAIVQLLISVAMLSFDLIFTIKVSIISIIIGNLAQYIPIVAAYIFLKEQYNKDINNNIIPEACESEDIGKMRRWVIINIGALLLIYIAVFFFITKAAQILKSSNI